MMATDSEHIPVDYSQLEPPARAIRKHQRSGAVLIIALICLTIVMISMTTITTTLMMTRQRIRIHHRQTQANWLAESGISRAVAHLRADRQYEGETWTIPDDQLDRPGMVTIRVSPPTEANRWIIDVVADYPADATSPARQRKRIEVDSGSLGERNES